MKFGIIQAWGFKSLHGSNMRVFFLLHELIKRNHKIIIFHAHNDDAIYTKKIFKCDAIGGDIEINRWHSYRYKLINYIRFVIYGRKIIKKYKFDAVFGYSLLNAMVATARKPNLILYTDFMSFFYNYANPKGIKNKILFYIARFLEIYSMKKATHLIVITEEMKKLIPKKYRQKTTIIPDGADTINFSPQKIAQTDHLKEVIRKKHGINQKDFVIGYQGGIEAHDGLQFLIKAAPYIIREHPDVKFLIVGRGGYLEKLKNLVLEIEIEDKFIFTGWIDNSQVLSYMAATDLNVIPAPKHKATKAIITFKLLESMAAGVNVIANDLPGIREIADENMIFFTNVESPEIFAKDILKVINTPHEIKEKMKQTSRSKIETLDWRIIAKRDADLLEKIATQHKANNG